MYYSITLALLTLGLIANQIEGFEDFYFKIFGINAVLKYVYYILYIATATAVINWLRRAYYNLSVVGFATIFDNLTVGWSWFVPIINLYLPFQIVKETATKYCEIETNLGERVISQVSELTKLINIWWTLWILGGFLDVIAGFVVRLLFGFYFYQGILEAFAMIAAAFFLLRVISKISKIEEVLFEKGNVEIFSEFGKEVYVKEVQNHSEPNGPLNNLEGWEN